MLFITFVVVALFVGVYVLDMSLLQAAIGTIILVWVYMETINPALIKRDMKKQETVRVNTANRSFNSTNFSATQKLVSCSGHSGIAIDESRKKICFLEWDMDGRFQRKIIDYRDVLASEIEEDGETVTKTQRGSQIGGALIGGLALGGAGAIIGGLSGKTVSSNVASGISLTVTVNSTEDPVFEFVLFSASGEDGFGYSAASAEARHWHGLLTAVIKQADIEDAASEKAEAQSGSVADELAKLAALKEQGILSDDEFSAQKQKLLAG